MPDSFSRTRDFLFLKISLASCVLAIAISSDIAANELLRIVGMGGTRIGTAALDVGIFGNPASLIQAQKHNVAIGIASENLLWRERLKQEREQFAAEANMELNPSSYYSYVFREWGISVGYAATFSNFASVRVLATEAEYDVNKRQFSAKTDIRTDYALFHEERWMVGIGRYIGEIVTGARLKWIVQSMRQGEIVSNLTVAARHSPDVDVRIPEQLIPTIVEELQFGNRDREITHQQNPTVDRITRRLELDVGFQRDVQLSNFKPIQIGILFENLLQPNFIEPLPLTFGIGAAYKPSVWIVLAADMWRAIAENGINYAMGAEFRKTWKMSNPRRNVSLALRFGARDVETTYFSIGFALTLDLLSVEYALSRPLANISLREAEHLLALTLHL